VAEDQDSLVAEISASLALGRASLALLKAKSNPACVLDKANWNRWPAGSNKGGQFAPKGTSAGPAVGGYSGSLFGSAAPGPKPAPKGAKPHPKANDKGQPVTIDYPNKASPASTWADGKQTATFTPGSETPEALNGVALRSWKAPTTTDGWAKVPGQNPKLDADVPFEPHPTKKTGAGVLILEADGRVWLTRPTNSFGGYVNTYPKGTAEPGLSLQANAIKEAYEETGLKVRITGVLGDYERDTSKARMFIAQRVGGTPKDMGWESQAVRLAPLSNAKQMLNREHDKAILQDLLSEMNGAVKKDAAGAKPKGKGHHSQGQPRWESGSPLGGQWKTMGADGITMPPTIAGGLTGANSGYQKKANAMYAIAQAGNQWALVDTVLNLKHAKEKWASGQKVTSHVKWNAQLHQYGAHLLTEKKAQPKAAATAAAISGPAKLSALTKVGAKPGGSNPGGLYQDANGNKWIVKGSNNPPATEQAKNEVLAAKLMQAVGAGAPDMMLVDLEGQYGGGIGVASKVIGDVKALGSSQAHLAAAQADFAVHAWLANYDVIGLSKDNTVIGADGKAINIDPGGALLYRAQGAPKGDAFGTKAVEFNSLRGPVSGLPANQQAWSVYGSMTASQIVESAKKLEAIDDATIQKMVASYGPGNEAQKAALAAKIIARKADVLASAKAMEKATAAAAPKPAAQQPTSPVAAPAPASEPAKPVLQTIYQNTNPGHSKFWAVSVSGNKVATHWGKIGTDGTVTVKEYANTIEAKNAAAKLESEKKKGGYSLKTLKGAPPKVLSALDASAPKPATERTPAAAAPTTTSAPAPAASKTIPKPVFKDTVPGAAEAWGKLSNLATKMYGSGDAEGLNSILQADKVMGLTIQGAGLNAKNFNAYAQKLLEDLDQKKQSAAQASIAPTAQAPKPGASVGANPAMPSKNKYKTDPDKPGISAATAKDMVGHNAKLDAIEKLAGSGDVAGIAALKFGSNHYGQKQAAFANDVLAAMGSSQKVVAGQKAGGHPTVVAAGPAVAAAASASSTAAMAAAKAQAPKPAAPQQKAVYRIPSTPDFANWNGPGKGLSSKAAFNIQNTELTQKIHALAMAGKIDELKKLSYQPINENGDHVGEQKPVSQHNSQHIKAYLSDALKAATTPYVPLPKVDAGSFRKVGEVFKTLSTMFPDLPKLTQASQTMGRYARLGKVTGNPLATFKPDELSKKNGKLNSSDLYDQSYERFSKLSEVEKQAIRDYTGSGYSTMNNAKTGEGTHAKTKVALAAFDKASIPLKAGTVFSRKFSFNSDSAKNLALLANAEGEVLKDFGIISTSMSSGVWGGDVHLRITAGEGVKGLYVAPNPKTGGNAISKHPGEDEVVLPYGTKFFVRKVHKQDFTDKHGNWSGKMIVDLVALPNI
jgi:predicted DNA-binding WGR domain protein/ADP-ribose pyrophosphatase YjhB (NUDIX family)